MSGTILSTIGNVVNTLADPRNQQQMASWCGIPFAATIASISGGESLAIHRYFGKPLPYVESTGKANQIITLTGWFSGATGYIQRNALGATFNGNPTGVLIHPSIGSMFVTLQTWAFNERVEDGAGYVEVQMSFIKSDTQAFPNGGITAIVTTIDQTLTAVTSALATCQIAIAQSLAVGLLIVNSVTSVVDSVVGYVGAIISAVSDPAQVINSTNGIQVLMGLTGTPGSSYALSRYNVGNTDGTTNPVLASINKNQAPSTVVKQATTAMLNAAVVNRATLTTAKTALVSLAGATSAASTNPLLTGIQNFSETFRAVINDPADQIRLLSTLAPYQGQTYVGMSNVAVNNQMINDAIVATCLYATLCSIALATTEYQPTSSNDVQDILTLIEPIFDQAILVAGNQDDTATFTAMCVLKAAVIQDLQTRGQNLAALVTINETANLPSVVIAYRQYQDPTRDVDVVQRINPKDPGNCPVTFEILAT